MKYMLLVHLPKDAFEATPARAAAAAGRAYGRTLQAPSGLLARVRLQSPQNATTVSVRDGKRHVQDGPYAESKEYLGGFVIIDVPDLDTALEWAARHPSAAQTPIEVRPIGGSSL